MLSPNPSNYLFPAGRFYFKKSGALGHTHLGNVPEAELTPEVSTEDHYDSMYPDKAVDLTYETARTLTGSLNLEEWSADNINLAWIGDGVIAGSQAAGTVDAAEQTLADDLYIDMGKTDLFVTKVSHGTVSGGPFTAGETVTGGTSSATGTVAWPDTGFMELVNVSGTFQASETITGGSSSASATTSGVEKVDDIVLTDAATPVNRYVAGTDYDVDVVAGLLRKRSTGSCGETAYASADYKAMTIETIRALAGTKTEGELLFIGDPTRGPRKRATIWKTELVLSGGATLVGEGQSIMPVDIKVLADRANHPSEPYMRWDFYRAA